MLAEIIEAARENPIDLLIIALAGPAGIACMSIPFAILMAWRRKAADVPRGNI